MGGLKDSIQIVTGVLYFFSPVCCAEHRQKLLFQDHMG